MLQGREANVSLRSYLNRVWFDERQQLYITVQFVPVRGEGSTEIHVERQVPQVHLCLELPQPDGRLDVEEQQP